MARVRNALCAAIHEFFQSRGFLYIHTPIITTNDCEGAGQMFRVTTLDVAKLPRVKHTVRRGSPDPAEMSDRKVSDGAECGVGRPAHNTGRPAHNTTPPHPSPLPKGEGAVSDDIDWSQDFFGKPAFLTVSGQLNIE